MTIDQQNEWLLQVERLLLEFPTCVRDEDVAELVEMGIPTTDAVGMLIAGLLKLDIADNPKHEELFNNAIKPSLKEIPHNMFSNNYYLNNIECRNSKIGDVEMKMMEYRPYELMPCGDLTMTAEGRLIAPMGFFASVWSYPALLEKDRIWMSITPNEIITMEHALEEARGKVVVLGLGMGYFAAMAAQKPEVTSIEVVELNQQVIDLVGSMILPQVTHNEKITITHENALDYMAKGGGADFLFADIWHDAGDGLDLYLELKKHESRWPKAQCRYWIEPSMKVYLGE